MSWRTITEDDIYSALSDTEATALRAACTRPGQEDPLPVVREQVAAYVRGSIRSNRDNTLSPTEGEIPEGVIGPAVDLIVERLSLRLSRTLPMTDERSAAAKHAREFLRDIASGKWTPEQYGDTPGETTPPAHVATIDPSRRRQDRHGLRGI